MRPLPSPDKGRQRAHLASEGSSQLTRRRCRARAFSMSLGLRASAHLGTRHDMLPSRWTNNGLSQLMATRPGTWDYSFEGAGGPGGQKRWTPASARDRVTR